MLTVVTKDVNERKKKNANSNGHNTERKVITNSYFFFQRLRKETVRGENVKLNEKKRRNGDVILWPTVQIYRFSFRLIKNIKHKDIYLFLCAHTHTDTVF